jgi:hypothetical protein
MTIYQRDKYTLFGALHIILLRRRRANGTGKSPFEPCIKAMLKIRKKLNFEKTGERYA